MDTGCGAFFSWTSRRVTLPRCLRAVAAGTQQSGLTLDRRLASDTVRGRLLAYHDADDDADYVALLIGDVAGSDDVPVRIVDEERLLMEGARSTEPAEILVGTSDDRDPDAEWRELDRQLCLGGPVRSMLAHSGARSVTVDWCAVAAA
ncbi:hypothetical protein [Rhodococcus indonesiensis]|uniref:Uncharacterized protein n=1 Tax=Rhodococcus indonesiensis TaxID=3055869 RepID=A0ABT7RP40_9NOCA|nr:hypothetical protein [Rhodococcus indonesiensis]MDM7489408.1 hypothetical protein [Rhodococcus indonesiensis]